MIGGFELPTGGILLRGRDVTDDPPDKRPVNMVFQHYALFPTSTSATTSRSGCGAGLDKAESDWRVGEALELVHLGATSRRKPTSCPADSVNVSRSPGPS